MYGILPIKNAPRRGGVKRLNRIGVIYAGLGAETGQTVAQAPQSMQTSGSMT
jgi:hypothetical protein